MSTLNITNVKNPSSGSNNITLGTDGSTRISTLADSAGANTSTPAEIASGRAKAWVNFNGTGTVAIRASYNVSSITDNGTGDYTVNFTSALADANYSFGAVCSSTAGASGYVARINNTAHVTAGSLRVTIVDPGVVIADAAIVGLIVIR